jgi:hypothetical protein
MAGTIGVISLNGDLDPVSITYGEKETADLPNVLTGPAGGDPLVSVVVQDHPQVGTSSQPT